MSEDNAGSVAGFQCLESFAADFNVEAASLPLACGG